MAKELGILLGPTCPKPYAAESPSMRAWVPMAEGEELLGVVPKDVSFLLLSLVPVYISACDNRSRSWRFNLAQRIELVRAGE